ncbi:hypothetical protein V490_00817 [Pseudogymnoascus sp. VKM F-3557]|nr:hypothetical protein V490_00817 [Pseudogymnoascus sp. VKM F-3557]
MSYNIDESSSSSASSDAGGGWGGVEEVRGDEEEQKVLFQALDSFNQYTKIAHYNTTHMRRQSFYALPQKHWELLAAPPFSYLNTLNAVDDAIDKNGELAVAILKSGLESFESSMDFERLKSSELWKGVAKAGDIDKARSTIRQFYRDWSAEGAVERKACYGPVMNDLRAERVKRDGKLMNVLVPGAGLGRLVFDLCYDGFNVEGNEMSYHQLLASSYILNYCSGAQIHTIFPWVHNFSNHQNRSRQLQSFRIPDIHPGTALHEKNNAGNSTQKTGEMSMSASDFICLYNDEEHKDVYDAIATVFFIDTAPNLIRYIETIKNCLKAGGIWSNIGPLLWHFENNAPGSFGTKDAGKKIVDTSGIADPGSVELTNDEVIALVEHFGFKIESKESGIKAGYIQDDESMLQNTYQVSHWVARKL